MGKICSKCGIEKELEEYYKKNKTTDDTRESCILCVKDYNKKQIIKRKDVNYIKKRKYFYNEDFFERIDNEEKAYFLGFLFADGCVINNVEKYRYQVTLKLHTKDKHILEEFIKKINGEMDVWTHGQRDICEINLSGKKIVTDLINKGVVPNKTFTITYPIIDEYLERHFLRGYFDGDGCIRISKDKRDGTERGDLRIVSGSIDMLNKINLSSFKTIILVGLFFRLISAIFSEGYGMHDDHFLTIEASASWVNNYDYNGWLPWSETSRGIPEGHSFTYVGLNYCFFAICKLIGFTDPKALMVINRVFHALLSDSTTPTTCSNRVTRK
jgi:hypothetical protein